MAPGPKKAGRPKASAPGTPASAKKGGKKVVQVAKVSKKAGRRSSGRVERMFSPLQLRA